MLPVQVAVKGGFAADTMNLQRLCILYICDFQGAKETARPYRLSTRPILSHIFEPHFFAALPNIPTAYSLSRFKQKCHEQLPPLLHLKLTFPSGMPLRL